VRIKSDRCFRFW